MNEATRDIVLIDDDEFVGLAMTRALRNSAWRVRSFLEPEQGIAAVQAERPAVLIVDIRMPTMDGDEVLEALEATGHLKDVRVLVSSSVEPPPRHWAPFESYGAEFLSKDVAIDRHALLDLLNSDASA